MLSADSRARYHVIGFDLALSCFACPYMVKYTQLGQVVKSVKSTYTQRIEQRNSI